VPRVPTAPVIADVIAAVEGWYDPSWAESWDAVGLVCGDPAASVSRIVLAIDAVPATVDDALATGATATATDATATAARLLITHHPLLLTAVHGVPVTDPKGALVDRMIRSGVAHYVAHTNAEVGPHGVSDALAAALGVRDVEPLEAASAPGAVGVGRVGALAQPTTLARFAESVAGAIPATVGGIRVSGDPARAVRRVAVLGGSGSSLLSAARAAGADVFVTADLKHHNAVEAVTQRIGGPATAAGAAGPMALIDVSHWASEVPWLHLLARRLRTEFAATVEVTVSNVVTDPWTRHVPSSPPPTPTRDGASERGQR
jgi:dinuclear metal center YbgI/SA1388 family protein